MNAGEGDGWSPSTSLLVDHRDGARRERAALRERIKALDAFVGTIDRELAARARKGRSGELAEGMEVEVVDTSLMPLGTGDRYLGRRGVVVGVPSRRTKNPPRWSIRVQFDGDGGHNLRFAPDQLRRVMDLDAAVGRRGEHDRGGGVEPGATIPRAGRWRLGRAHERRSGRECADHPALTEERRDMPGHPSIHPQRGRQLLDDGAPNPAWLEHDATTGCLRWLGSMTGGGNGGLGVPQAEDRASRRRNLRRDAWVRAHGPIPAGRHVATACGDARCLEPAHLRLRGLGEVGRAEVAATKHAEPAATAAARLGVAEYTVRAARGPGGARARIDPGSRKPNAVWAARGQLPDERPAAVSAEDWRVVRDLAAGSTLTEVAAGLGVSRQMVHHRAKRALARMGLSDERSAISHEHADEG